MMMAPLYPENNTRNRRRALFSGVALALIIAMMALYTDSSRTALLRLVEPVVMLRAMVLGDSVQPGTTPSYDVLRKENQKLAEELMHTRINAQRTDMLQLENELLREQAGIFTHIQNRIQAVIVRRPPETLYDTLLVAAGEKSGVVPGSTVSVGAGFVGRVAQVGAHTAVVVLASAPGEETRGFLMHGTSTHPVRVRGLGQGAFESLVPRSIAVTTGDTLFVYTDEWEVVATVSSVSDSQTEALVRITLTSPNNLWHTHMVDIRIEDNQ